MPSASSPSAMVTEGRHSTATSASDLTLCQIVSRAVLPIARIRMSAGLLALAYVAASLR
jgi:hypothetical protein